MSARGGTLLAKMGFRDSDRADPMHDAACAYVAANARKVYEGLTGKRPYSTRVSQEVIISKGDGQYKTTVGFADLIITSKVWDRETRPFLLDDEEDPVYRICADNGLVSTSKWNNQKHGWVYSLRDGTDGESVGIEVKWTEKSVSDAIRQISVYRSFCHGGNWIWALAAPYPLNTEQRSALNSSRVKYVQLNEGNVRAFAAQQRSTPAASEMVL